MGAHATGSAFGDRLSHRALVDAPMMLLSCNSALSAGRIGADTLDSYRAE